MICSSRSSQGILPILLLPHSAKFARIMVKIRSDMLFRIAILILNYTRWIIPIAVGPTAFEFTTASCLADDYLPLIDSKIRRDGPTHAIRNNLFHGYNETQAMW